jgi:hypothetical protein
MKAPTFTEALWQHLAKRDPAGAARYAGRCRGACAKLGVHAPAWAAGAVPARPTAPAATPEERRFTADAQAFGLPAALLDWRRAESGRVVHVDAGGRVQLSCYVGGRHDATFQTINAAVYALATGSVRWQAQRGEPAPKRYAPRASGA